MKIPPSMHFTPISLADVLNARRESLPASLQLADIATYGFSLHSFQGIPFELGPRSGNNVLLLDRDEISIDLSGIQATYVIFLHAVEDRLTNYLSGFADDRVDGNELGQWVSEYALEYMDGTVERTPILRRFAIQQSHIRWGASAFEAVPALKPGVFPIASESQLLGRVPVSSSGEAEVRHVSGRERLDEHLWLYALPNPQPAKKIRRIVCTPKQESSLIYAISSTTLADHPLRPGVRQKLCLELPPGVKLNRLGELEDVELDLGTVISAHGALQYDRAQWLGHMPNAQPLRSERTVVVEYAAHPRARLYVGAGQGSYASYDLSDAKDARVVPINPARRPVRLRVVEKGSNQPVAARLHLHGQAGEYLPPRGHHRKVNPFWFEDNYAEFVNGLNQYSYIAGECDVDLPLGEVFAEITRGCEVAPLRCRFDVTPETDEITLESERVLHWRREGWVTADTHVHFLSPQTALLEGAAEGVNVVNLLASQWGEMFSNVGDFDGRSTIGAKDLGGDGEFLVRVGTENRMQVLGHISLLGYAGPMIHPLCTGGPSESAIGDAQEVTMAEWARQCIAQNGLVVMPHAPNPQCERAADIVLGLVHAVEMMTFNPFDAQLNPYGIADWYRYLNLGYHLPIVGGSDKMSAASLLGGVRTYTHLGDRPFTYEEWKSAVRAGNTFATVGPLVQLAVEGQPPGRTLRLPASGGTVNVSWKVESVSLPIERVEIVVGGMGMDQTIVHGPGGHETPLLSASGTASLKITQSTWIALRVRGSYRGQPGDIAAHTSAVQVLVEGTPLFSPPDSVAVLEQIEGAIAYVDTLAPRPDSVRYPQLRATLASAHELLHQTMHHKAVPHHHTPVHNQFHSGERM